MKIMSKRKIQQLRAIMSVPVTLAAKTICNSKWFAVKPLSKKETP